MFDREAIVKECHILLPKFSSINQSRDRLALPKCIKQGPSSFELNWSHVSPCQSRSKERDIAFTYPPQALGSSSSGKWIRMHT